ncbi:cytochrome c oxidase subunit IV-domain-containing protein [Chiua virens]|nr:cytochrome c oxidase subunit IV-domain-containing protein [Chiua virens]
MEAKAKSCYKCGQEGHIVCLFLLALGRALTLPQSRDCTQNASSGYVGHIARSCPEGNANAGGYGGGGGGGGYGGGFGGGGGGKTCYTCGGVGHLSRDCVQGSKCYNCSGIGHISRECPQPQRRACYTCGSEGHISRDCPQAGGAAEDLLNMSLFLLLTRPPLSFFLAIKNPVWADFRTVFGRVKSARFLSVVPILRRPTMQAIRLACPTRRLALRRLTTAAAASSSSSSGSAATTASVIPLSNVEAQWEKLSKSDQASMQRQLEEIQKKDWKTLSVDEKKAAYYVAFGPHGPRTPVSPPGQGLKVFIYTMALVGVAAAISMAVRSRSPPPPKTLTREWQEASNERALEQKLDPITGIASQGYAGKGFVQK